MLDEQVKDLCNKLKPIIGQKAEGLWLAYLTADTIDLKREAESFIQMFAVRHLNLRVDDQVIRLPPPTPEQARGDIHLGEIFYGNKDVGPLYLRKDELSRHTGIYSITGGGKSNLAQHILLGLLEQEIPFLVVDWKRSYREILGLPNAHVKKVKVFTVGRSTNSALSWNPLRPPPGVAFQTWISTVAESLERSHISGQGVAEVLTEILDRKFSDLGFYEGKQMHYPNFFDVRDELARVKVLRGRRMLWVDTCVRIVRTFTYGPAAKAFNARNPVALENFLNDYVILEIDQELSAPLRTFFMEIILRWIYLYRLTQGEVSGLRSMVVLEEVHNLFPRNQFEKNMASSLDLIFRQIRGFGTGLLTITQHPSLVPISILGNCHCLVFLPLSHEDDIQVARKALFLPFYEQQYLNWLKTGEGIVKIQGRFNPCHVRFPFVPVKKGGVTDEMLEGGSLRE